MADGGKPDLRLHALWACVLLVMTRMAAKAAEALAAASIEAARLTGETAVRAAEATGARAATAVAAALAEPARRGADAAEQLAEAANNFRRVRCEGSSRQDATTLERPAGTVRLRHAR